jgi:hypothetical protein
MYIGRRYQGQRIGLALWCLDSGNTPTLPDAAPIARVLGPNGLATSLKLPIIDRYGVTAYFGRALQLDSRFAQGQYSVNYQYAIGGMNYGKMDNFLLLAGGAPDGSGLAMFYFAFPGGDQVLLQTEMGRIIRRRNPQVA